MKHDLIVGTVITVISYGLLFLYCVVRNVYREHIALVEREKNTLNELNRLRNQPPWAGCESEAAWKAAIDEQNRLVYVGHAVDGVFSSLQIEVLLLAGDLRKFIAMSGKRPVPQRDDKVWLPDGTREWLVARNTVETPWVLNLVHSYADKYAARVKHTMYELGAAGLTVWPLAPYTESIIDESNIVDAADILEKMALEVGALQRASKT